MVLNYASIKEKLNHLDEYVENLMSHAETTPEEFVNNRDLQWIIERGLTLCAEIIFDIGNHLLKAKYGLTPKNNEMVLAQLKSKDLISNSLYKELRGLGKFRNLLIHDYAYIDPEKVLGYFKKAPPTFRRFIQEIMESLEGEGSEVKQ